MASPQDFTVASVTCVIATLLCAWRVYDRGITAKYPAFFAYLVTQAALIGVCTYFGLNSRGYAWAYVLAYPVLLVVSCLVARELYNSIFEAFPGVAALGRWCVYFAVALSVGASVIASHATQSALTNKRGAVVFVETLGRSVVFGLALSIILLVVAVSRFPIRLRRNIAINCVMFSVIMLGEAGLLLAEHLMSLRQTLGLDTALMIFNAACFGTWGFLLTNESDSSFIVRQFTPLSERRMLDQLVTLNEIGLRASRK